MNHILSPLRARQNTWVLAIVMLVAAILRLQAIDFGLPALNDPDELIFELGALKMLRGATLDPGWFGHPATTTMYCLAIVNAAVFATGWLLGWFSNPQAFAEAVYADPTLMILPGRVLMAMFGLLCVWAAYRLGERLFGRTAGLVTAALVAINPVLITYSQIIRSDMQASFFMLMCLGAAIDVHRTGKWRNYIQGSIWLGLAIATKWPFALGGLSLLGAICLRMRENPDSLAEEARRLATVLVATVATLIIVSPYLLIDYSTVLRNLRGEAQPFHLGASGGGALWNLSWYARGPVVNGIGALGLLSAASGILLSPRRADYFAIVGSVTAGFVIIISFQTLVWERWSIPVSMLLAIPAGSAFARVAGSIWRKPISQIGRTAALLTLGALVAAPLVVENQARARERSTDTRQLASAWAHRHVPSGSVVLIEHYAFDLISEPWAFLFPLGAAGCLDARALLKGKVAYGLIDKAREGRSNLDLGTVDPPKLGTCRADYAVLTQLDRYGAERSHFQSQYDQYLRFVDGGRVIATFRPVSGTVGGPIVRIVSLPARTRPHRLAR